MILQQQENCDSEQWVRWDEELVEEFGRWLGRLAKALGVLLLAASAAVLIGSM